MSFKDHFSKHAADYAKFRPRYPQELFAYLGSIAPSRQLAWDCGTGNGQAAVGLASVFDRVIATDASETQIANAQSHERMAFRVAHADNSGIASETIDLIMVAQALHWFDLDRFYAEARRVLKNNGVCAASAYNLLHVEPAIDEVVNRYYYEVVGPSGRPSASLLNNLPISCSHFAGSCAEVRNDSAMESRSSDRLSSNMVFDKAVHRCARQRSLGTGNR